MGTWGVPSWLRTTELVRMARAWGGRIRRHLTVNTHAIGTLGTSGALTEQQGVGQRGDWDEAQRLPWPRVLLRQVGAPGWADHNPGEYNQSDWPCPPAGGSSAPSQPGQACGRAGGSREPLLRAEAGGQRRPPTVASMPEDSVRASRELTPRCGQGSPV